MLLLGGGAGADYLQSLLFCSVADEPGRHYGQGDTSLTVVGQFFLHFISSANQANLVYQRPWDETQRLLGIPGLPGHSNFLDLVWEP
jgi:hypothetical protein